MNNNIKIGSLIKYTIHEKTIIALVVDIDDDGINLPLYHLLSGDKTSWEYLNPKKVSIIA
jgi:hypothetical protein